MNIIKRAVQIVLRKFFLKKYSGTVRACSIIINTDKDAVLKSFSEEELNDLQVLANYYYLTKRVEIKELKKVLNHFNIVLEDYK